MGAPASWFLLPWASLRECVPHYPQQHLMSCCKSSSSPNTGHSPIGIRRCNNSSPSARFIPTQQRRKRRKRRKSALSDGRVKWPRHQVNTRGFLGICVEDLQSPGSPSSQGFLQGSNKDGLDLDRPWAFGGRPVSGFNSGDGGGS